MPAFVKDRDWIAILDFGSQYTHLIARRVRECGIYSEIVPFNIPARKLLSRKPSAIILSGGPSSVISRKSPVCDKNIFSLGLPALGICYGAQLMASVLGGKVSKAGKREYGKAILKIKSGKILLKGLKQKETVWMSHGDKVTKLPAGFKIVGSTANSLIAAVEDRKRKFFGVQFHPEVIHTPSGKKILKNFVINISGCKRGWNMRSFVNTAVKDIRNTVGNEKVLCGLSGGVDSSVLARLLHKAIGKNLVAMFIDNGLLRKDEARLVEKRFKRHYRINLKTINAGNVFLKGLKGVRDPEKSER